MKSSFLFLVCVSLLLMTQNVIAVQCQNGTSESGLPKAVCQLPGCPDGGDCAAPVIEAQTPVIHFQDPIVRWLGECQEGNQSGPCWKVELPFDYEVKATDGSGVSEIGLVVASYSSTDPTFKTYWTKATAQTSSGHYVMQDRYAFYAKPGAKVEVQVFQLCAKDSWGNERCVYPKKDLSWKSN